jgi:hypothetical protein
VIFHWVYVKATFLFSQITGECANPACLAVFARKTLCKSSFHRERSEMQMYSAIIF